VSSGGVVGEGFDDDTAGVAVVVVVVSSSRIIELRRRLWFDETHDVHAEVILPRRWRVFVSVAIAFEDDDAIVAVVVVVVVAVFFVTFRWCRRRAVEGRRDEILGVELFRRV
jgi:hypothetical protein